MISKEEIKMKSKGWDDSMDIYAKEILKAALSNHAEVSLGMIVDDNGTYSDVDEYFNHLNTLIQ